MSEGGYFGDIDIIFRRARKLSVIALEDSDFLTLSKKMFEAMIMQEFPDVYEEMYLVAYEREKRIKKSK